MIYIYIYISVYIHIYIYVQFIWIYIYKYIYIMPASGKYYSRPRWRQLLQNGGLCGTMASRPGLRPAARKVSMVYDLFMLGMSMGRYMDNKYIYIYTYIFTYIYIYVYLHPMSLYHLIYFFYTYYSYPGPRYHINRENYILLAFKLIYT